MYFEPKYLWARRFLTKIISMTSIIDDIYDANGTLEELKHFTKAIERFENSKITNHGLVLYLLNSIYTLFRTMYFICKWDINNIDHFSDYMKLFYVVLLDVYKEIEEEMVKDGYQYWVHYAIEAVRQLYISLHFI